jgi:putative intracellular protease/amidase
MKRVIVFLLPLAVISLIVYIRLQPLRALNSIRTYTGETNISRKPQSYNKEKKTVVIMADNNMTELFDMLAPFYLFSETGKANVYIAAQEQYPILTKNGPFIMPHLSYREIDSLNIHPDVIVVPYMNSPESTVKTSWIKKHYSDSVIVLSICDGAWTAAATGLYDGKPLTSHATGHEKLKKKFSKPHWVQNVRFTQSGNLYSTGGISNAADGSLAVIQKLFGYETMLKVLQSANYPLDSLQTSHTSIALNTSGMITAFLKMLFKENKRICVVLQNGANEMDLAAVYDTYNRTLPESVQSFIQDGHSITTRHGLVVLPTDKIDPREIDELHLLPHETINPAQLVLFKNAGLVSYDNNKQDYILDICLARIKKEYGQAFQKYVKATLDYN